MYEMLHADADDTLPTLVFCGGFRSDMTGGKARAVCDFAHDRGLKAIRFDYFAHGLSDGDFSEGSIGRWVDDTLAVVDNLTQNRLILAGSSMGGWIATEVARLRSNRMAGLALIAAAPDFTHRLLWKRMTPEQQIQLMDQGVVYLPNDYSDEPYRVYRHLIIQAREHLLLEGGAIPLTCPVRLVHGLKDSDVPWQLGQELMSVIASDDIEMCLVKDGDHHLSTDRDLRRLQKIVSELVDLSQKS